MSPSTTAAGLCPSRPRWEGRGALLLFLAACSSEPAAPGTVERGSQLYRQHCAACHHPNPKLSYGESGTFGPALHGSSRELLAVRIRDGGYPAGYEPKRKTGRMPRIQLTDSEILSLHRYINQDVTEGR